MFIPIDDPAFVLHYRILLSEQDFNFHFNLSTYYELVGFVSVDVDSFPYIPVLSQGLALSPYNGRMYVGVNRQYFDNEEVHTASIGSFIMFLKAEDFHTVTTENVDLVIRFNESRGYTISVN